MLFQSSGIAPCPDTTLIGIVLESIVFSVKLSLNEHFDSIFFLICLLLIPDLSYKNCNIFTFYFFSSFTSDIILEYTGTLVETSLKKKKQNLEGECTWLIS